MADNPFKPRDDGNIRLPSISDGMNKIAPTSDDDDKVKRLGAGDEDTNALLTRARKRMDRCISAEADNRKAAREDLDFIDGKQWPDDVMAQRNSDRRPCLTINRIPTFLRQITNDQRMNRPQIVVNPIGEQGDKEVAKIYRGLIRCIERESCADIAYDTAFESAVSIGFGYFRIITEYESPQSFDQVISIKRIRNPFTVYLDPDHQEPDGADIRYAFVTELIPRHEFEDLYPAADQMHWTMGGVGEKYSNWADSDAIRIAEYFEIKNEMKTLIALSNGWVGVEDDISDQVKELIAAGHLEITKTREAEVPVIHWYKLTAVDILEERTWPGKWIPIVKVSGNEIDIEGKIKLSGVVRSAKDPQRMFNYWRHLAVTERIPTPTGWTTMGELAEGDQVFDEQGTVRRVVGLSPVFTDKQCFRVIFDDKSEIVASAEHPWTVEQRGTRTGAGQSWETTQVSTVDLVPNHHFIWVTKPLDLPDIDLPIDPYLLGVWLGDGSAAEPRISQSDQDMDELRSHLSARGLSVGKITRCKDRIGAFTVHGVRKHFVKSGLLGNKHIPAQYLRASQSQRLALLQGLMDTDGSVSRRGQCSFTNTNRAIVNGVRELLRTLGIKPVVHVRDRRHERGTGLATAQQIAYQFSFTAYVGMPVFKLARKISGLGKRTAEPRRVKRHRILSVTPIESVAVKCIKVDSPSHLFLAGSGMIPTHNTAEAELIALAPKAPYIMEEGQLEGHEQEWKQANTKSYPYLLYKGADLHGKPAPPPQRQQNAGVPQGVVNAAMNAAQDMIATTGIRFDANREPAPDESGKALRELRRSADLGSFHYSDNLARSLKQCGRILIDLIPKVYDTKRVITIMREDDSEQHVTVDPQLGKGTHEARAQDGKAMMIFNPTYGEYGITITTGPSFATKRIEASESMMQFARAMPQVGTLIADLIAKNQDWPGAEEMAARLAKAVPPQLMTAEQKDMSPQVQALIQSMDTQIKTMTQERTEMMRALSDQSADRTLKQDKINKDFEAKIMALITKLQAGSEKNVIDLIKDFSPVEQIPMAQPPDQMALAMSKLAEAITQMNAPRKTMLLRDQSGRAAGAVSVPHDGQA